MADHPAFISIPSRDSTSQPLRSALKQTGSNTSRPATPRTSPPITSPQISSPPATIGRSSSAKDITTYFSRTPRSPPTLSPPLPSRSLSGMSGAPLSPMPLTAGFAAKVSFDTFENPVASMFSYTLRVKTDGYARTPSTRVFLCASSPDESGAKALDWALDALAQDGDELVVFRGIAEDVLEKDHESCREDARDLMRQIQEKATELDPDRKLHIVVEFIAGKVTDTIDRLIALYRPDSVVVGTRGQKTGLSAWSAAFVGAAAGMGSVSKYCLSRSPVPIIVVRPESKVRKTMAKRRADPKRGKHFETMGPPPAAGGRSGVPMSWTLTK